MSAIEAISLVLITIGTVLSLVCVATPFWKINDPEDTARDTVFQHEGLWLRCTSYSMGNWDCDDYNRVFLGLSTMVQIIRALSVIAVAFSILGTLAMSFGLESCSCGPESQRTKCWIRLAAAGLSFLAGACILVPVSWYANDVRINHNRESLILFEKPTATVNRYIYGYSLFFGWGGGVLLLLGALFILCTSCLNADSYEDERPHYSYRPPTKSVNTGQEYI